MSKHERTGKIDKSFILYNTVIKLKEKEDWVPPFSTQRERPRGV